MIKKNIDKYHVLYYIKSVIITNLILRYIKNDEKISQDCAARRYNTISQK